MIHIERFVFNMFQENTYVVSDETGEAVVIDCGAFYDEERKAIADYIDGQHLTLRHLIATHGHIDHNFGNNTIFDRYGLKPCVPAADEPLISELPRQAAILCRTDYREPIPPTGLFYTEQDQFSFGSHTLHVMHTPGHSPGSSVLYDSEENVAFSGDTLFRRSIGRTDFLLGSFDDIQQSLSRMVSQLPADMQVMTGHGQPTTIGEEARANPYIDR